MNPAALKTNVGDLPAGGALIVNSDAFSQANLNKAAYATNPLTDGSLKAFTVFEVPISTLNERSLDGLDMTTKQKDLTKNFFALGLMFWLYERSMEPTLHWIDSKFSARPVIADANKRALKAGYAYGETTEMFHTHYRVPPAKLPPGTYRNITGNEATALGFLTASKLADRPLFYGSYPITPASDILHELSKHKRFGVTTFQAEDEIAGIGAAIGAYVLHFRAFTQAPIIAYEPNPTAFALAEYNVAANHIKDVALQNAACSDIPGEVRLCAGINSYVVADTANVNAPVHNLMIAMRAIRLDDDLRAAGPISLIKIDCEGFEYQDVDPSVECGKNVRLLPPVSIAEGCKISDLATIGGRSSLGKGSVVGEGAVVEGSILLDGAEVEAGAVVRGSVIGPRARVGNNAIVRGLSVLGAGCVVGEGNVLDQGIRVNPGVVVSPRSLSF